VACRLRLHPQKTKIVYCKDAHRTGTYPVVSFDFLGYTFRPRLAKWPHGEYGVAFLPAASHTALKGIRKAIRLWALQRRSDKDLDDLARMFGSNIRGWINYYSHFYKSALYTTLGLIDDHLAHWAQRKFKRLRQRPKGARTWLTGVIRRAPGLFPPLAASLCERPDAGSRMSRETHVRFWERAAVKARRATRRFIFGERHLRRVLVEYAAYFNQWTLVSLDRLASPLRTALTTPGCQSGTVVATPVLGGLHHVYQIAA